MRAFGFRDGVASSARWGAIAVLAAGLVGASNAWSKETLQQVMKRRGLTQENILAASKTYVPTGGRDEFLAFSSGGQSGSVIVYGIPSMRILKYIAVFTPEPWQAYGFDDESKAVLAQGRIGGRDIPGVTRTIRPSRKRMGTTTASTSSSTTRRNGASPCAIYTTSRPSRSS